MQLGEYKNYIAGVFTDGEATETFDVLNPATEEVLATVSNATPGDVVRAVTAATDAQPIFADAPAHERANLLRGAAARMRERSEHLARIMTLEEGKPLAEARGEVLYAASFLDWFAEEGKRVYGDMIPSSSVDKRILVFKRPVGVTAAITPWNFPAAMITRKLAPALAAGCAMIIKPSELTPLSALEIARIFDEVGLPKGVLSVLASRDPVPIVKPLMDDPRVRKISFTGSTEVGKILMRQAADTVKRLSLELGGHAPLIVFEDANLETAVAQTLACKMRGMGETCVSANRIYVQRSIYDAFTERFTSLMQAMKTGDGLDPGVSVGPLVESAALEKVERHVQDALDKGAQLLLGGTRVGARGYFYSPTVLKGVDHSMLITKEETFGPVAAILPFDTEEEVLKAANDSPFGLASYLFTRDIGRIFRMAEHLEYGIIGINDGIPSTAQAPFGGVKASGLGREGSKYGIEEYLDIKYVSLGGINA